MNITKTILLLILLNLRLMAQEFGLSYSKMWSDDKQLKDPSGYGIHLYVPIKSIAIRAEYNYARGEGNYFGFLVSGFFGSAEDAPKQENVTTTSIMKSYDISLWFPDLIGHINPIQFNIGAGIGLNHMEGNRKGSVSGHEASFSSTDRIGWLLGLSLSYPRPFDLPLKFEVQYRWKAVPSSGVNVVDSENVLQDAIGIKQLSFGISYIFR